jgi:tRNA (guanine26-N2/guanine27-N2)-dimethyltransferase
LHTVSVSAARYGRTMRPVLSVGMAFYVRVFVEIHNDKRGVNDLSLNIGHVYQSTKCSTFVTLPHGQMGGKKNNVYQSLRLNPATCPETGAPFKVGGPLWLGPLHDQDVVQTALERLSHTEGSSPKMELIATRQRLQGLLTSVSEEIDTPLYYTLPHLCKTLGCSSPPLRQVMAAISNAGYAVSGFHKEPSAIKTNAPHHVVWDVMRAWLAKHPSKKAPAEDSAAAKILAVKPSIEVDFTIPKSFQKNNKVSRFPNNPEKNWGPKRKASGKRKADDGGEEAKDGEDEQPTKRTATNDDDKE